MTSSNADAAATATAVHAEHYDPTTIRLHWLTAALVVTLWIAGKTIDWFAKGDPRIYARSTHIAIGLVLALVVVTRIVWRVR
ncbi:MAG: cytochrome b/b6 domain-containing protein, partial [Gammaproteobacteria bacterium]|nr:cytochrome b/b6 domain-containing protein [Gammaproteobacteria bacterium]